MGPPLSTLARYGQIMCRSIKTLRRMEAPATSEEVHAAALQFVRKVSGFRQPSRANAAAFEEAVAEISRASQTLLDSLESPARLPPSHPTKPTGFAGAPGSRGEVPKAEAGRARQASPVHSG
jgi:hypothetical protein